MTGMQRSMGDAYAPSHSTGVSRSLGVGLAASLVFAALTWVGANIYIPLVPVPVTLQTLFVLLAGSIIGGRYGTLSQLVYVLAGVVGVPVFAGNAAGWAILGGPTGGYLVAFFVAPVVIGRLIGRSTSIAWQASVFALGTAVIFVIGVSHLALFYTHDVATAIRLGFLPFIPGAVLKIAAALSIHRSYTALTRHRARRHTA